MFIQTNYKSKFNTKEYIKKLIGNKNKKILDKPASKQFLDEKEELVYTKIKNRDLVYEINGKQLKSDGYLGKMI